MAKWFGVRNAPGSRDLNPQQEWLAFRAVLADALGRTRTETTTSAAGGGCEEPTKRHKSDNCDGTDSDWEYLCLTTLSTSGGVSSPQKSSVAAALSFNSSAPLFSHIPIVFYALHLFYENIKIDSAMRSHLLSLAEVRTNKNGICGSIFNFSIYSFSTNLRWLCNWNAMHGITFWIIRNCR